MKFREAGATIPGAFKDLYHVLGDELVHVEVQGAYARDPFRPKELIHVKLPRSIFPQGKCTASLIQRIAAKRRQNNRMGSSLTTPSTL